ncbi:hypothetical protein KUTeg_018011 [Tegillarca granosa]|uniref:Uncharacterized protein n=1 Tax=Tegillarca granosa TaxID=220873 RepID=A0ABQ9EGL7_TEGGR|nr:hypothetical protein KUTeg_018011 [Tegillarca granosa]
MVGKKCQIMDFVLGLYDTSFQNDDKMGRCHLEDTIRLTINHSLYTSSLQLRRKNLEAEEEIQQNYLILHFGDTDYKKSRSKRDNHESVFLPVAATLIVNDHEEFSKTME